MKRKSIPVPRRAGTGMRDLDGDFDRTVEALRRLRAKDRVAYRALVHIVLEVEKNST